MLPVGNESSRTSLLSVGAALLKFWTVLTLVGLLLYVALWVLRFREFAWFEVGAIACVTAALAVLLAAEEGSNDSQVDAANMTLAGCVYLLLTKHMIALGITVFALAGGVAGAYYIISSLVSVEYQGSAGTLVVKLPGQTVYYRPLYPYGWEDTEIKLEDKQTFEVEITGRISPGLMHEMAGHIAEVVTWERTGAGAKPKDLAPQWKFTGPEGYPESFYDMWVQQVDPKTKKPRQRYDADPGLTVCGRRHNEVIGVIVGRGERPCHKLPTKNEPCEAIPGTSDVPGKPGYDVKDQGDVKDQDGKDRLYFLSAESYKDPLRLVAQKSGTLWLTVNDAGEFRYDNIGLFFVKVTISRW
jgi:hypothetical protein